MFSCVTSESSMFLFQRFSKVCLFIDLSAGQDILILQIAAGEHAIIVVRKAIELPIVPQLGARSLALFVGV